MQVLLSSEWDSRWLGGEDEVTSGSKQQLSLRSPHLQSHFTGELFELLVTSFYFFVTSWATLGCEKQHLRQRSPREPTYQDKSHNILGICHQLSYSQGGEVSCRWVYSLLSRLGRKRANEDQVEQVTCLPVVLVTWCNHVIAAKNTLHPPGGSQPSWAGH